MADSTLEQRIRRKSTLARMAGNIAAGLAVDFKIRHQTPSYLATERQELAEAAVDIADRILTLIEAM